MNIVNTVKGIFTGNQMADISLTAVPGEAALVALATFFTALVEGESPEQKAALTQRFIDLSDPWHQIAVEISKDAAGFVRNVLKLNPQSSK